jgi:iron-sulfur cluster protein
VKDGFPQAARAALADSQLRRNLGHATTTIRDKRARVVGEVPDWEALRDAGAEIKDRALRHLDVHLERLEEAVQRAGGIVHWARDGAEAAAVVAEVARAHGSDEVIKVKSLATDEIDLNDRLEAYGIHAVETDLAELINQLSHDTSSHILVPAIHRNRAQIAALFRRELGVEVSDEPAELTAAARAHLRAKFLSVPVGVSGANFAVAETGHVVVLESEGNGRMCTTLPEVLVSVVGIEKILPRWRDLEVMLQLLPRSSTGERMNPYTSIWSGVADGDGPREFHLVLLDAGRTDVLADEVGRAALRCIRCSACLNVCPSTSARAATPMRASIRGRSARSSRPAAGPRERADAAVGQLAVRRLLRGVPGEDRHPVDPRAPARARRAGGRQPGARARRDGGDGAGLREPARLRGGAARGQARARPAGRRRPAAVDALTRAAQGAQADVQGLVA